MAEDDFFVSLPLILVSAPQKQETHIMSDRIEGNNERIKDQAPEMISTALRWIVTAGLATPVILTLRSKPLLAQTTNCSAWMSISYTSHQPNPGAVPDACKTT